PVPGHAAGGAAARPRADPPVGAARPRGTADRPGQLPHDPAHSRTRARRALASLSLHDARAAVGAARARAHQQYRGRHRRPADRARAGGRPAAVGCRPADTARQGRRPGDAMSEAVASPAAAVAADPWRRFMGATYECILLFGVVWFADYLFSALTRYQGEAGPLRLAFQLFTGLVL